MYPIVLGHVRESKPLQGLHVSMCLRRISSAIRDKSLFSGHRSCPMAPSCTHKCQSRVQEATLRRHFVRRSKTEIDEEGRARILDEARQAVDEALADLSHPDGSGMRAARRTVDNLWVERAATYGFLASAAARRGDSPDTVWSGYLAAREAVRNATGKAGQPHIKLLSHQYVISEVVVQCCPDTLLSYADLGCFTF